MTAKLELAGALLVGVVVTFAACGGNKTAAPADQTSAAKPAVDADTLPLPSESETQLPQAVRESFLKPFKGDLNAMIKRRVVRIGVTFNRTFYFIDKGVPRGVAFDYAQLVEQRLNKHFKTGNANKVHVVVVPLPRDMLLSALVDGKVDMVAAQVTMRPELQKLVDFTKPTRTNVRQILVTGPDAPPVASVDDLSGKDVFAREKSTYYQSLLALNEKFKAQRKAPITIHSTPGNLEDDDLLEMVNAGLIPAIVVDDYMAAFWKKVFPNLTVHNDIAVRSGGSLAVGVRKNSPQLAAGLNTFIGKYGLGTSFGNQIERKYLVSTKYVKNATSDAERQKFLKLVQFFRKYSDQYKMDYLLMAAQGYQESQLNQDAKSQVGAIGVMQVMPATGKELNVGDIRQTEANIHAGIKYMRWMIDQYYGNEPMTNLDKALFAFASYNAGASRISSLRKEAATRGLDPNVWFQNVEVLAAKEIGRETVQYVSNIFKYYVAYRLVMGEDSATADAGASSP